MVVQLHQLVDYRGVQWVVLPGVFEPRPNFGGNRLVTKRNIQMYAGKKVLDIGCGCGVRSIIAALAGAREVIALDVVPEALESTRINAERLGVTLDIRYSDLFSAISSLDGLFDMIVAYLPSFDQPIVSFEDIAEHDPGLELHRRLLDEARDYLSATGILHTTFLNAGNISQFTGWVEEYGYSVERDSVRGFYGEEWHFFDLSH